MYSEEEPITPESFQKNANKYSIAVTQAGFDLSNSVKELVDFIVSQFNELILEEDREEVSNSIFNEILSKQIDTYIMGCEYFVKTFKEYCNSNNIQAQIVSVDDIMLLNHETQQSIIDSSMLFLQSMSQKFDNPDIFDVNGVSFEGRVRDIISLYLESALILGLTEAKNLNYNRNKPENVRFGNLASVMEAIFPG